MGAQNSHQQEQQPSAPLKHLRFAEPPTTSMRNHQYGSHQNIDRRGVCKSMAPYKYVYLGTPGVAALAVGLQGVAATHLQRQRQQQRAPVTADDTTGLNTDFSWDFSDTPLSRDASPGVNNMSHDSRKEKSNLNLVRGSDDKQQQNKDASQAQATHNCQKHNEAKDNKLRQPMDVGSLNDCVRRLFGSVGRPVLNLPPTIKSEKPFSGRNRLYVGNLPRNAAREAINKLMAPYGEIVIDYCNNEKMFGFVRLETRQLALTAQRDLNGRVSYGKILKVKLQSSTALYKVLNLDEFVTNELLRKAFSVFGEIERADIMTDDGYPNGTGYVEFTDKKDGQRAFEACAKHCFLLTSSPRPVILEELDQNKNIKGFSEAQLPWDDLEYKGARRFGPRFISENSPEYSDAMLWKSLHQRRKQEEEKLVKRFETEDHILAIRGTLPHAVKQYKG